MNEAIKVQEKLDLIYKKFSDGTFKKEDLDECITLIEEAENLILVGQKLNDLEIATKRLLESCQNGIGLDC
jgi:hypothetical protein